jgi:hypothetical protein
MLVSSSLLSCALNPIIEFYQLGMLTIINISLMVLSPLNPSLGYRFVPIG